MHDILMIANIEVPELHHTNFCPILGVPDAETLTLGTCIEILSDG